MIRVCSETGPILFRPLKRSVLFQQYLTLLGTVYVVSLFKSLFNLLLVAHFRGGHSGSSALSLASLLSVLRISSFTASMNLSKVAQLPLIQCGHFILRDI